jgi:hypothetical protein
MQFDFDDHNCAPNIRALAELLGRDHLLKFNPPGWCVVTH